MGFQPITINRPVTFDQQFVDNVVCSILEGGINYWAVLSDIDRTNCTEQFEYPSDAVSRGAILVLQDTESGQTYRFGLEQFVQGLTKYLNGEGHGLTPYTDAGDIDAYHADVICQLGLFGEVVYG